jgi:hypothetical protein
MTGRTKVGLFSLIAPAMTQELCDKQPSTDIRAGTGMVFYSVVVWFLIFIKPFFPESSGRWFYSSKVVLIEYGFASRNTPQASSPIWGYRELNANMLCTAWKRCFSLPPIINLTMSTDKREYVCVRPRNVVFLSHQS